MAEWTPERRARQAAILKAAREKKQAKARDLEDKPGELPPIVPIESATKNDVAKLLAEIETLRGQLAAETKKTEAARQAALTAMEGQSAALRLGRDDETPTGRTIKMQQLDHYDVKGYKEDGREILKPVFKMVDVPTFYYTIDMPPCGGTDLKINGISYYHGQEYELDEHLLRTVKEIVFRTWDHDRQIHGTDENVYRKKTNQRISGRGMN